MTVTTVQKDAEALTMTLVAEFEASPERVWQLWDDPRQLERWWGPPSYPATVTTHDLTPGGRVEYHMTGPEGDQPRGYWEVTKVEPPSRLEFTDGFSNADGSRSSDLPTMQVEVRIEEAGDARTLLSITTNFANSDAMDQLLSMGMEEGLTSAVGQIDALLAEAIAYSNTD
ncbi:MAG: SRPBCC domain-containing protein [Acidimicrobiia bacterium]